MFGPRAEIVESKLLPRYGMVLCNSRTKRAVLSFPKKVRFGGLRAKLDWAIANELTIVAGQGTISAIRYLTKGTPDAK